MGHHRCLEQASPDGDGTPYVYTRRYIFFSTSCLHQLLLHPTLTGKDPVLSRVCHCDWDTHSPAPEFQLYFNRKMEVTIVDGCLLVGAQVAVPPAGRDLGSSCMTAPRMKVLTRSYVGWPGLDAETMVKVQSCQICQESRPDSEKAPLSLWERPSRPWARLHLDHADPFLRNLYLVIMDAHSK